jgi:hypothetical protein
MKLGKRKKIPATVASIGIFIQLRVWRNLMNNYFKNTQSKSREYLGFTLKFLDSVILLKVQYGFYIPSPIWRIRPRDCKLPETLSLTDTSPHRPTG